MVRTARDRATPLHLAAHMGNGTLVDMLTRLAGARNLLDQDAHGRTPLGVAIMARNLGVVSRLCAAHLRLQVPLQAAKEGSPIRWLLRNDNRIPWSELTQAMLSQLLESYKVQAANKPLPFLRVFFFDRQYDSGMQEAILSGNKEALKLIRESSAFQLDLMWWTLAASIGLIDDSDAEPRRFDSTGAERLDMIRHLHDTHMSDFEQRYAKRITSPAPRRWLWWLYYGAYDNIRRQLYDDVIKWQLEIAEGGGALRRGIFFCDLVIVSHYYRNPWTALSLLIEMSMLLLYCACVGILVAATHVAWSPRWLAFLVRPTSRCSIETSRVTRGRKQVIAQVMLRLPTEHFLTLYATYCHFQCEALVRRLRSSLSVPLRYNWESLTRAVIHLAISLLLLLLGVLYVLVAMGEWTLQPPDNTNDTAARRAGNGISALHIIMFTWGIVVFV